MTTDPTPAAATTDASTDASGGFHGAFRQSMSWLHTWVGLVLGVVLYFMFVTGTTGYFVGPIDRWMQPEVAAQALSGERPDALPFTSEEMAAAALAAGHEAVARPTEIGLYWPTDVEKADERYAMGAYAVGQDEAGGDVEVEVLLDPWTLKPRGEGGARETSGGSTLYAMHYNLHYVPFHQVSVGGYFLPALPTLIVGVATMFMLVAVVTGVVVHKKIFADFFTFRPGRGQRSWLDAHNLASVLALPFMVVITYSGLMFYYYDYMPTTRDVVYGTSEEARAEFDTDMYPDYYLALNQEPAGVEAPVAPVADLLAAGRAAAGGVEPYYLSLFHPGDANARAIAYTMPPSYSLEGYAPGVLLDAVAAEVIPLPETGPNPMGAVERTMITIHEGNYAGPVLRWLYVLSGAAGSAMIATGLVLWTAKRRQKLRAGDQPDLGLLFVERTNVGLIVGLLVGVAAYFWANRLLPVSLEGRAAWEVHVLFIAWGACLVHAAARPARRAWPEQFALAAALFAALPILNALTTAVHLGRSLPAGDWELAGFDLTALALGLILALAAHKAWANATRRPVPRRARRAASPDAPALEPAE